MVLCHYKLNRRKDDAMKIYCVHTGEGLSYFTRKDEAIKSAKQWADHSRESEFEVVVCTVAKMREPERTICLLNNRSWAEKSEVIFVVRKDKDGKTIHI